MTWTGRPDEVSCCGDDPGAVREGELVARLLHNKITVPEGVPFTRQELTWHGKKAPYDNTCGLADGVSVERCSTLSDEELRRRARALAQQKDGRRCEGALLALADDLRAIQSPEHPGVRAVYVYDDPRPGDREHAVVRVLEAVSRPAFDFVRNEIEKAFLRRVMRP